MAGSVDEATYDILECFPILVCQNVFKYLEKKDIIEASVVNKEWYKFVATDSKQVKKLKLVFTKENEQTMTDEDVDILNNSKRKYQNIELQEISFERSGPFAAILAARAGSWKSVVLQRCEMFGIEIWTEILGLIEPSVEKLSFNLRLEQVEPTEKLQNSKWTFPCLKSLKCFLPEVNMLKYFVACTSLVQFYWSTYEATSDMTMTVLTLLRNNQNLKNLGNHGTYLLEHSFEFKLQKLSIAPTCMVRSMEDIHSFLKTHAQTLESLEALNSPNRASWEIILSMPRLSSLRITANRSISSSLEAFPVSLTITSLQLRSWGDKEISFGPLLRALPSLKHFKINEINDETFFSLDASVPALESIETGFFSVTRIPERNFFPNLRSFKADKFHKDLQVPTGDFKFADLLKEEMRKWYERKPVKASRRKVRDPGKRSEQGMYQNRLRKRTGGKAETSLHQEKRANND